MRILSSELIVSYFIIGNHSNASAVAPQTLQATPNVLCSSHNGQYGKFFLPFLGAVLFSAMLLVAIVTVCCCVLFAPYVAKDGRKDKGETISLRPMKREASRGEPSRKVYDSDSIVSSSGAAVPKPVATERGVGKGTPVVESIYASEIPKVKHSQVCIYSSCILHSVIHYTLNLKVVVRRHNVHRHKMLMLGLDGCRISHMQHTTCHVCNRVTRKNWNFSLL